MRFLPIKRLSVTGETPVLRLSQVPRIKMAKMRNELIHEYFGVDFEVLWKTLHQDLPPVRDVVARILKDLEQAPKD
ncbi:DUF86 domain-containing protein [Candidatus Sumerlaeota bacterium]|nr:DUF86 domain-containing protein [Candidatus Sumerlaeota bacterium]